MCSDMLPVEHDELVSQTDDETLTASLVSKGNWTDEEMEEGNTKNMAFSAFDALNCERNNSGRELPVGSNGKTPKTESNSIALADSLVDMPNRENIVWYTDGQYQGGTARGCDCVNLFDPDTNVYCGV